MAVDDIKLKSEISFSIPHGTLSWQPIFVVLSKELFGVVGRRRLVAQSGGLTLALPGI